MDALSSCGNDVVDAILFLSSTNEQTLMPSASGALTDQSSNLELLMLTSGCSEGVAKASLERANGDLVDALLNLVASTDLAGNEEEEEEDNDEFASKMHATLRQTVKREQLFRELVASEETFVRSLLVLKGRYVLSLLSWSSSNAEREHIREVMQRLSEPLLELIPLNQSLLENFREKSRSWEAQSTVGECFSSIQTFEDSYSRLVLAIQATLPQLDSFEADSTAFRELLNALRQDANAKQLDFRSHLIGPVQRVPRYQLFLRDLLKVTSETHPDFEPLKSALTTVQKLNLAINSRLRDATGSKLMAALTLDFVAADFAALESADRILLKDGVLMKLCSGKKLNPRRVLLFNDILAYAKPAGGSRYKLCEVYPLSGVRTEQKAGHAFGIKCANLKPIELRARSMDEQLLWMQAITNQTARIKE